MQEPAADGVERRKTRFLINTVVLVLVALLYIGTTGIVLSLFPSTVDECPAWALWVGIGVGTTMILCTFYRAFLWKRD